MIRRLKCKHCEYVWDYKGIQMFYCGCPRCKYNVNVKKQEVNPENEPTTKSR